MPYFEFRDEKSAKFWQIDQQNNELHIRWGKINTDGQQQVKSYADDAKARAVYDKLIKEKIGKGYQSVESLEAVMPSPPASASAIAPSHAEQSSLSLEQKIEKTFRAALEQIASGKIKGSLTNNKLASFEQLPDYAAEFLWGQFKLLGFFGYYGNKLHDKAGEKATELLQQLAQLPPPDNHNPQLHLGALEQLLFSQCYASRRHPQPLETRAHNWPELAQRLTLASLVLIEQSSPDLQLPLTNAIQSLQGDTPTTENLAQTILLRLFFGAERNLSTDFVDYLVTQHGLLATFERYLQAQTLGVAKYWQRQGRTYSYTLSHEANALWSDSSMFVLQAGEARLRMHLACVDRAEYQQCVELAHAQLLQLPPLRQAMVALLFPDEVGLSHQLLRHYAEQDEVPYTLYTLILTATEPELIQQILQVGAQSHAQSIWYDQAIALTLLREREHLAAHNLASYATDEMVGWVLTRIGTVEALTVLACAAGTGKPALARFNLAVARWPVVAISALANLLSAAPKYQTLLLPVLKQLVRENDEQLNRCLSELDSAAKNFLTKIQQQLSQQQIVASAEDLPEVLRQAPWDSSQHRVDTMFLTLEPLSIDTIESWIEDEKQAALSARGWGLRNYHDPKNGMQQLLHDLKLQDPAIYTSALAAVNNQNAASLIETWLDMYERTKAAQYAPWLNAYALAHLPTKLGVPLWNAIAGITQCYFASYLAAQYGIAALPGLLKVIRSQPQECLPLIINFGYAGFAAIAAHILVHSKKQYKIAQQWLDRYPEHAACGLIAAALGKTSVEQKNAAIALRWLNQNGHDTVLQQVAQRYQRADVIEALNAVLNQNPLLHYPSKRNKLPTFWQPQNWHRPCLKNGKALPDDTLEILGTMLTFPTNDGVYAGIPQVVEACDRQSLADFGWDCFSAWLASGAPGKEGWALIVTFRRHSVTGPLN